MIEYLISRLILPLLLFLVVRYFFHGFFSPSQPRQERPTVAPRVNQGGELKKDPVCGTFVSTSASIQQKVKGETFYFCSTDCRDRYKG
jgi:YHS domain-containing protein